MIQPAFKKRLNILVVWMPNSTRKLCRDCTRIAVNQTPYCPDHQTKNNASEYARLYESYRADDEMKALRNKKRWQGTRRVVFQRDPLCMDCGHQASTVCDHIVPARQIVAMYGEDEFYNPDRCQGLCKSCHDRKTATEDSTFAKQGTKK